MSLCKHCAHMVPKHAASPSLSQTAVCGLTMHPDLVDGGMTGGVLCAEVRARVPKNDHEVICGVEGRLWKPQG